MLSNSCAKLNMNDTIIKVICLCFILKLNGCLVTATIANATTTASIVDDDSAKNLTVRSINDAVKSDDAPLRINLAANILSVQSQKKTAEKLSEKPSEKTISNSGSISSSSSSGSGSNNNNNGHSNTQTIFSKQTIANKVASSTGNHKVIKDKSDPYECPNTSDFTFFPQYCSKHVDCVAQGREMRCCRQFNSKRCVKGVPKPLKEQRHEPILGLIPRKCPKEPLAELFWELKTCKTDHDCWPRICCPDGIQKYCRTSRPDLDTLPAGRQFAYPIDALSGYLQCTPPPPSDYDLHPQVCNNTLDCFPNVCCQEAGKKHCRPPKRSLLAFITTFAQRFNTGFIKQWTDNLVIRR